MRILFGALALLAAAAPPLASAQDETGFLSVFDGIRAHTRTAMAAASIGEKEGETASPLRCFDYVQPKPDDPSKYLDVATGKWLDRAKVDLPKDLEQRDGYWYSSDPQRPAVKRVYVNGRWVTASKVQAMGGGAEYMEAEYGSNPHMRFVSDGWQCAAEPGKRTWVRDCNGFYYNGKGMAKMYHAGQWRDPFDVRAADPRWYARKGQWFYSRNDKLPYVRLGDRFIRRPRSKFMYDHFRWTNLAYNPYYQKLADGSYKQHEELPHGAESFVHDSDSDYYFKDASKQRLFSHGSWIEAAPFLHSKAVEARLEGRAKGILDEDTKQAIDVQLEENLAEFAVWFARDYLQANATAAGSSEADREAALDPEQGQAAEEQLIKDLTSGDDEVAIRWARQALRDNVKDNVKSPVVLSSTDPDLPDQDPEHKPVAAEKPLPIDVDPLFQPGQHASPLDLAPQVPPEPKEPGNSNDDAANPDQIQSVE